MKRTERKCINCFNFMTRVIPNVDTLEKSEFRKWIPLKNKVPHNEVRVWYCLYDRKPITTYAQATKKTPTKTCNYDH